MIQDCFSTQDYGVGGRSSSAALRETYDMSADFTGLDADTDRFALLNMLKSLATVYNLNSDMLLLIEDYIKHTRDIDWRAGSRPIVFKSATRTAFQMGWSLRKLQRIEKKLFDIGALSWHDSGNHKRYGQRCMKTGRILYAYGVDLTPLAYMQEELEQKQAQQKADEALWMETRRQISWYRRQIRGFLAELEQKDCDIQIYVQRLEPISKRILPSNSIEKIKIIRDSLKALRLEIIAEFDEEATSKCTTIDQDTAQDVSPNLSPRDDKNDVHYNSYIKYKSNKLDTSKGKPKDSQGGCSQNPQPSESPAHKSLMHITLKQALNAAPESFRDHIDLKNRALEWGDLTHAAYSRRKDLRISQEYWQDACTILGRSGAAICLLITDQASQREDNAVKNPPAYFKSMIKRAETGELHLHRSIFGILGRDEELKNLISDQNHGNSGVYHG